MHLFGIYLHVHSIGQSIPMDFVCLEPSEHFTAAAQLKSEWHFTRIEVKPPASTSHFRPLPLPPSALPTCRLARCCGSAAAPSSGGTPATATKAAAAAASPYQHTSVRQMIHPLRVLQTNTLPPSRCLSAMWFIRLSPHITASPPDAFSFRQIIDST